MLRYWPVLIVIIVATVLITVMFKCEPSHTYAVYTYRVTDYNGDETLIQATHCRASGPAMRFDLPDGRVLWLIDVAEVEELP